MLYIRRKEDVEQEDGTKRPIFLVSADPEFAGGKTEGFALQNEQEAALLEMLIVCVNRILKR